MKRIGLTVLILAALLMGLAAPVAAAPRVTLTARAGNEGRIKQGSWVGVVVDLTNEGGDLSGDLVVEQSTPPGVTWENRHPTYVVPVALPAGGKKRVPVAVPMAGWSNNLKARFVVGGQTVASQELSLVVLPGDQVLAGVLSADELGLPALGQTGKATGSAAQVVRLDAQSFPATASLLADFDVIAIDRFDTSTLSADQIRALRTWVGQGGTLLLAGGPEWKRSFTGLPADLVPVQVTGMAEADLAPLGAAVGKELTGQAPVSLGTAVRGQVAVGSKDVPLLVTAPVGNGRVVYLAADATLNPVANWSGLPDLLDRYLAVQPHPSGMMGDNDWQILNALQRIPGMGMPSVLVIAGLLAGYLLLVGPVNYLALKRLDRREWAWATVPLISVLFVVAVWGVSSGRRLPLLSHVITVTELTPGTGTGTMKSYVGLYAPAQPNLTVPVRGTNLIKPLGFGSGPQSSGEARVVFGETTRLELTGLNSYELRGLALEQDVAVAGGLEVVGVKYEAGKLTGRVRNRLNQPLDQVSVTFGGGGETAVLGRLEAGDESQPFTLEAGLIDPKIAQPVLPGIQPSAAPMDAEQQRRMALWDATFQSGRVTLPAGSLVVAGWAERPLAEAPVANLGRTYQGANLVYAAVPIPFDPSGGDLPPGLVQAVPQGDRNVSRTPNGWLLPPGAHPFVMQIPGFRPDKVAEVKLYLRNFNQASGLSVRAKNRKTGAWVDLESGPSQVLKDWADLIGSDGALELQITVNTFTEMGSPTISIKGVGQ